MLFCGMDFSAERRMPQMGCVVNNTTLLGQNPEYYLTGGRCVAVAGCARGPAHPRQQFGRWPGVRRESELDLHRLYGIRLC